MPPPLIEPASARLIELASRGESSDLAGALLAAVKPNLRTGAAAINAAALDASLHAILPEGAARETSGAIQAFFAPGFLIVPPPSGRRGVTVPWGTVGSMLDTSRGDLARMVAADLGLKRATSVKSITEALEKQTRLPDLLRDPEVLERFSVALRQRNDDPNDPGWDGEGPRPKPKPGGGAFPVPPAPLPNAWTCVESLGTWTADGWGVMLCVSSPCAESIALAIDSAILTGSFTNLASAVGSAAVAALSGSSLAGFCVAVALTMVGGVFKIWILTENQRSNGRGVCIRFMWPWIPFIGGWLLVSAR